MRLWIACVVAIGCSSNEAPTTKTCAPPEKASGTTCVAYDGPVQDGNLPYEEGASGTSCRQCAPRCDAPSIDGYPTAAALPSGSCAGDETCDLAARLVCACPEARGPLNAYRCSCESGRWRCRVVAQGASICLNSACDAAAGG